MSNPSPYNINTQIQGQKIVYHNGSTDTQQTNVLDNIIQQQQENAKYDEQVYQAGGKNSKTRRFRIIKWNDEIIPQNKKSILTGREPAAAARKALRSQLNPKLPNGQRKFQEVKVLIKEISRNKNTKEKLYLVKREKLNKPRKITVTNKKTGKPKQMKITHKTTVKKLD